MLFLLHDDDLISCNESEKKIERTGRWDCQYVWKEIFESKY